MNTRIWRLAGVSLLALSISAQVLADDNNQQQRNEQRQQQQRGFEQQRQQQQNQQRSFNEDRQREQRTFNEDRQREQQNQQQQRQQQQQQYQQQRQQEQMNQQRQIQQQQQQRFDQQRQQQDRQRDQQRQEQLQQQQRQQQQQMQQRQFQDRQSNLPIQSRPDTAVQTQPPRQGFYRDQPRDNPWRNGDNRPPVAGRPGGPVGHGDGWGSGPRYRPGYEIDRMPGGYSRVPYRGNDYFYSGGYWYRPQGPRYVVVAPPRGVRVRYLPDYAQQVWLGSALFFLAAGTYYTYEQSTQEYVVAEPPQGVEPVYSPQQPVQQASPYEVTAYPANGQGPQQVAQDRYDCYQYAVQQSNFDPSTATYQPAPEVVGIFRQAMAGCYASRGYSVQQ